MKNLLLTTVIVGALLTGHETKAQIGFNLSVHIGNRPAWGVPGNVSANYYYMPEIDAYYDLSNRQFIYEDGGRWIFAANLPDYYRNYDLRTGYKVIVNEPRPYMRADFYRQQYRGRYDTYNRRQDVYAQRNVRPEFRNDNRYEQQRGFNNDQRNNNDRFNQGRNDDHRNDRFDNRNDQRNNNDRSNQGRIENNRIENNRIDQRANDNHGNQDRNDGQRPDIKRNDPVITAPQQSNDHKDDRSDNRGGNNGQVRTAQRRG